jgi:hypothetical protein
MEKDVNRAIKQLEIIAIKAMNSGYLDDAAKVMHIAEEIERVDKASVATDSEANEPEPESFEAEQEQELAVCSELLPQHDANLEPTENVVALNRFRVKRDTAVGDNSPETPLT